MAWMEAINDASERHGVLRKLPRSAYTPAFRAYKHTFMRSEEFVTLVERPKQEILCCCCAGAGPVHVYGDACFKAFRCAANKYLNSLALSLKILLLPRSLRFRLLCYCSPSGWGIHGSDVSQMGVRGSSVHRFV